MRRCFKYRAYPTKAAETRAIEWLDLCRRLYNAALEQRIRAYQERGVSLHEYTQALELKTLKTDDNFPEYRFVGSQVLKDVLRRLDRAYQAFFRRVKRGDNAPGFPHFKGVGHYNSFTFPNSSGWKLSNRIGESGLPTGDLTLSVKYVGNFKLRFKRSRPIEGEICTVTVERTKTAKWFVCFSCKNVASENIPPTEESIGIDVGTMVMVADSRNTRWPRGEFLEKRLRELRILQRRAARQRASMKADKRESSKRLDKTYDEIRQLFESIVNRRSDFINKVAHHYARNYKTINIENLDIIKLIRQSKGPFISAENKKKKYRPPIARLRILDAAWGTFFQQLKQRSESLGHTVVEKESAYTTMTCSRCGHVQRVNRAFRMFDCQNCGLRINRKVNAARNINGDVTPYDIGRPGIAGLLEQFRQETVERGESDV